MSQPWSVKQGRLIGLDWKPIPIRPTALKTGEPDMFYSAVDSCCCRYTHNTYLSHNDNGTEGKCTSFLITLLHY